MTETKTLNRDTPTEDPADKTAERKRPLDLSASQLTGGALAAMTSAVIGAQLGVAGTIAGAAVGSIVAGVAGSLYTASLKHTKDKLASVIVGRVGDTKVEVATVADDTAVRDGWSWDAPGTRPMDTQPMDTQPAAATAPPAPDSVADLVVDDWGKPTRRLPWKGILVSTAAVFLLAIAGITGFELISGQAISGGQGTTVSQVSEGRSGGSDTPSQSPSSTPSSETSTEPSSTPSTSTSTEPTSEPSTGQTQTAEPSQSPEPSASSEPTTSGTPSTASGDQSAAADTGDDGAVAGR